MDDLLSMFGDVFKSAVEVGVPALIASSGVSAPEPVAQVVAGAMGGNATNTTNAKTYAVSSPVPTGAENAAPVNTALPGWVIPAGVGGGVLLLVLLLTRRKG